MTEIALQGQAITDNLGKHACIVPMREDGSMPAFFCVHAMNGTIDGFQDLAEHLGPDQPFYAIRSPFLDGEMMSLYTMRDLARYYVDEMRKVQPDGPYYIGGYSMGGRIAFAMAHYLKSLGQEVGLLVLLDSRSYIGRRLPPRKERLGRYWQMMTQPDRQKRKEFLRFQIERRKAKFTAFFTRKYYSRMLRRVRRKGKKVQPSFDLTIYLNNRINLGYVSKPYDGRAVLLKVDKSFLHSDVHDGWQQVFTGRYDVHSVEGRHLTILTKPFVQEVADVLGQHLKDAAGR